MAKVVAVENDELNEVERGEVRRLLELLPEIEARLAKLDALENGCPVARHILKGH